MQIGPYDLALIGVASALLGAVSGALIGYYFSRQLLRDSEKRDSARRLHAAFSEVLLSLDPAESTIEDILSVYLKKHFEKHRSAVYDYSLYLSNSEKKRFMNAWYAYIRHPDHEAHGVRLVHFQKYSTAFKSHEEKIDALARAKQDIENVLTHAKL